MKKVYNVVVSEERAAIVERGFNILRVDLNHWAKNRFVVNDCVVINYTFICDDDTYNSITNMIWMN